MDAKGLLMKIISFNTTALLTIIALLGGCNSDATTTPTTTPPTSAIPPGNDPNFTIVAHTDAGYTATNRKVVVFGIPIYAYADVEDTKLLHAANLMAQYLDNNEDGVVDNPALLTALTTTSHAALYMWKQAAHQGTIQAQDLGADESVPAWHTNGHTGTFDAALEEVWHVVTASGYAVAYPGIFGESVGSSSLTAAMDIARGGQFINIPSTYPAGAWYRYNDATCNYNCMSTEYIYWAMSSILGAQAGRLNEIQQEWNLNTAALVQSTDSTVYALLTNPKYSFPTVLPDGTYTPSAAPTVPTTPPTTTPPNTKGLSPETIALGITNIPSNLSTTYTAALKFNRYTSYKTANGNNIHIVAQTKITDEQVVRARSILTHYLTDYPGSQYGADKSAVANKIAENGATLLLLNGVDDGTNPAANLDGQPLYFGEMQVEGNSWYIAQDYTHRDASFEEILHFVHDNGIGVDQMSPFRGVLPAYQAEIRAAQVNALNNKLWGMGDSDWITEITADNSLSQEYLAAVIDSYYGLWGAYSNPTNGMWGMYVGKTRTDMATDDPQGMALLNNKFFHPYLTYNARIDKNFVGDFSLAFNTALAYTHHSQYLKDITLTGDNPSNVIVNQLNNNITGNSAENIVIFTGPSSEYQINSENGQVTVQDLQDSRDGLNTLTAIEKMRFSDITMNVPST